jgi:hypothetical protein
MLQRTCLYNKTFMVEPGEKVMSLSDYEMNVFMQSNHFVISTPEILPNDTAVLAKFTELLKKHGSSSAHEHRKQSFFVVLDIGWPPNGMTDIQLLSKYKIKHFRGNRPSTIGNLQIHTWDVETPSDRYFVIGILGRDVHKIPLPSTIESILRELLGMHSSTGVPQPESRRQDERGSRRNGLAGWLEYTPGSSQPESRRQDRWLEYTPGSSQPESRNQDRWLEYTSGSSQPESRSQDRWLEYTSGSSQPESRSQDRWLEYTSGSSQPLHTPKHPRPTSQMIPYNPEDPPGMKWDWMLREWVDETAPRRGFV